LDVGDQSPLEARAQAFLEVGDLLGVLVGGEHDLLVVVVQGIEGVEELVLGAVLAGDELDVVHQQHVEVLAEPPAELLHLVGAQRRDELVHELLGGDVADARQRLAVAHSVADGV
jgi:hypothetical protein